VTNVVRIEENLSALLDDHAFQQLDAQYRRFNLFSAIGAVHSELRHSNFLAFLLSPNESHGLGADFLTRVLRRFLQKLDGAIRPISSLELQLADLESAIVERERDNIDILIEVSPLKLVVIIENKIRSPVADGQLTRYKEIVRRKYDGWHQIFVLLTPEGYDADSYDPDYVACSYSEIVELLADYTGYVRSSLSAELVLILDHYLQMVKGNVVDDEKLKELARQLYYRHRDAFEFVYQSRPDLLDPIKSLIEIEKSLVFDRSHPLLLRFAPVEWSKIDAFNACPTSEWTKSGRNVLFEVKANKTTERITVGLVLGPADKSLREFLYSGASKMPSVFINLVKPMGAVYSTIFIRELLSASAAENMEPAEKSKTIEANWNNFVKNELPKIKAEIEKIVQTYQANAAKNTNEKSQ
jgi:PD-(D/E)XK nuclease superfamily